MPSDAEDLAARLDRIKRLIDEYLKVKAQSGEVCKRVARIRDEVDAAGVARRDRLSHVDRTYRLS